MVEQIQEKFKTLQFRISNFRTSCFLETKEKRKNVNTNLINNIFIPFCFDILCIMKIPKYNIC